MASEQDIGNIPLEKSTEQVDIQITHPPGSGRVDAVVRDSMRQRAWSGSGPNENAATTEAVRKFMTDPQGAKRYLPK